MSGVITLLDQPRTLDALGRATDALIYFYYTGTTVLAPIYNDEALTDPAVNPVEIAAGEIFPDIYLDPIIEYRRRILYGDGTIHDVDPLPSGGGDANSIVFTQSGDNAKPRSVQNKLQEYVSITDYDGTTVQKLKSAALELSSRGGGVLFIPKGDYELNSSELSTAITLTENTYVEGNGASLTVTGTSIIDSIFSVTDSSNVKVRNLYCYGNGQADAYNNGAFINVLLSSSSTEDMQNICIEDLFLQNFKAPWWVHVRCSTSSHTLKNITIRNIVAKSVDGNSVDPTSLAWNASVICVAGAELYVVKNVYIDNISVDASYIKTGIIIYHGVINTSITNVSILNAGNSGSFSNDAGCYALMLYDTYRLGSTAVVKNFEVSGRSCGIYVAGFKNVIIENGTAFNQTDSVDSTLPKGGIATNGTRNLVIRNVKISNCLKGLQIIGPEVDRADTLLEKVYVDDNVQEPLRITPFASFDMNGLKISQCRFVATGVNRGADIRIGTGKTLNDFTCEDSLFQSESYFAFDANALSQASTSNNWLLKDSRFITTSSSGAIRITSLSGQLKLRNCYLSVTTTGQALQLESCTNISLSAITSVSDTGGVAFSLTGAQGTIDEACLSIDASTPVLGLGAAKPTHSGRKGNFVYALNYTAASSGDGQSQIIGWRCQGGTVWRPVVETVNAA